MGRVAKVIKVKRAPIKRTVSTDGLDKLPDTESDSSQLEVITEDAKSQVKSVNVKVVKKVPVKVVKVKKVVPKTTKSITPTDDTTVDTVDVELTPKESARRRLENFLEQHRVTKGHPFTHTTKEPTGSYYIGEDSIDKLYTLYSNAISKGNVFALTERPLEYGPLRVDVDLKAELSVGTERQYTEAIVKKLISYYQELIKSSIDPDVFDDSMVWCVLLEKSSPRVEGNIIKDGFHLHFPNFICSPWFQDVYLRESVTRKMSEDKLWDELKFMEKPIKFIDTNMGRKPWLMYGSAKALNAEPFMFSRAYSHTLRLTSLEKVFTDQLKGRKCSVMYYLPRFLSIRNEVSEPTKLKLEVEQRILEQQSYRKKRIVKKTRRVEDILADLMMIKEGEIMDMLSQERADNYDTWMDVGWTLFCIGQGCEEALDLWKKFSKRSSSYWEGVCEQRWDQMEIGGKSIGSLLYMAKADDPERYNEWRATNINNCLYRSLVEERPNEWDLSQVISSMYKYRFVCSDSKNNIWYEFINHRWKSLDDNMTLRKLFPTEVKEMYYNLRATITKQDVSADEATREKNEKTMKRITKIITALKTLTFQEKLLKMCKVQFHDEKFEKKKDMNKYLFGCENGVLDLKLGLFREGRPDDYVTKSCGQDYNTHLSYESEEVQEVMGMYEKMFPNPNIRRYFLQVTARALKGGNDAKIFFVHTGSGDNGKTINFNFIAMTFGEYYVTIPREVLLEGGRVSANASRPELMALIGGRYLGITELAKNETISLGMLKSLSGNDKLPARNHHDRKLEQIDISVTPNYQCNDPPKVPGNDDAAWDRLQQLPYESRFVIPRKLHKFPVPATFEEQLRMKRFHADLSLENRFPQLTPAFLWILFDVYCANKDKNLAVPKEVTVATNEYRAMHDIYSRYATEHIKLEEDEELRETTFLKVRQVRDSFDYWYKSEYDPNSKVRHAINAIGYEFSKKLGPLEKKSRCGEGWFGYKIVFEQEDGDDDNDNEVAEDE